MRRPTFLINPASGGRQGAWLLDRLRERHGDACRVLAGCDLRALARTLGSDPAALLVACGGDGTAAAALEAAWLASPLQPVPVGVIPLGTGNDLARSLGWRPQVLDVARLEHVVHRLVQAPLVAMDRWLLIGPGWQRAFYNYLSLGADARVAARFHALRAEAPQLFRHARLNQLLYAAMALGEPAQPLDQAFAGGGFPVPPWARAVVVCAIPSYAGGTRLHPAIRADDGCIEAFALGAGAALGLAVGGVRRPRILDQGRALRFTLALPVSAQLDGEPLTLPPGTWTVARQGSVRLALLD